ncbi:MAG: AsmA family protein [Steroidobacteraceae bacterium]
MPLRSRAGRITLWVGVGLAGVFLLLLLVLAFVDWNQLKRPIERIAAARFGRTVSIGGALNVDLGSLTPRITVEQLVVGNPPWESARPMMRIKRLEAQLKVLPLLKGAVILPRVALIEPDFYLHRDASGRANWTFESTRPTKAPAEPPPKLPVVQDFLIESGHITLRDEMLHLDVLGTIEAREKASKENAKAMRIEAKGTLNRKAFSLRIAGGPLVNLNPERPYPFDLAIKAGDIRIDSEGTVRKPFDLGRLRLNVRASGSDLADLYYLTQLALPNTPPFKVAAHVERNGSHIAATRIAGTFGRSDIGGKLSVDASRKRPAVTGNLESKELQLKDLAAALGGNVGTGDSLRGKPASQRPSSKGVGEPSPQSDVRLFPDARLQVNRVRAMDADVRYRARSIHAGMLPFKQVAVHLKLNEGVIEVRPFEFEMPQGKLSGTARVDARHAVPHTALDVRIKNVQLEQLKGRAPDAKPPLAGTLLARIVLEGTGDSVHDVMAGADGRIYAIVPGGEVRAAFAELTGINVARGLGLLLKGDDERARIRCGIAQFDVEDGTMRAEQVVFDTEDVRITGRGEVRLGPEELELKIKGEPKKLRVARLRTPVIVGGHLRKPSVGIDAGKTAEQGAIAAALGAVTPFAAILAFIDPGLAKDENCAALLAPVQTTAADTPNEKH